LAPGFQSPFRLSIFVLAFASAALLVLCGCDHKPGVNNRISLLQKAFPAATASAQTDQPASGQPPRADANACVQAALTAMRSNDYATAILMLNSAVRAPGITPDQFLALQQAKKSLFTDLENRAERGDAGAQAALKSVANSRSR
jgi:hypothetical protein